MDITNAVDKAKPTCTYKCPPNFQLKVNVSKSNSGFCDGVQCPR